MDHSNQWSTLRQARLAEAKVEQQVKKWQDEAVYRRRWGNETKTWGCGWAHHSQTRSRIPEGWSTEPTPLLPLPATQAVRPPWAVTSSLKNTKSEMNEQMKIKLQKTTQWRRGLMQRKERAPLCPLKKSPQVSVVMLQCRRSKWYGARRIWQWQEEWEVEEEEEEEDRGRKRRGGM